MKSFDFYKVIGAILMVNFPRRKSGLTDYLWNLFKAGTSKH
ncbi:MAG: hypothetical protein ACTSXP_17720 [Promethearchaeota archaeon]